MRAFLILHGWDNFRPPGHWQRELATALEQRDERVVYPQLPDAARRGSTRGGRRPTQPCAKRPRAAHG
ncbi:hypothetical protein ACRAWB_17190 [Leifsonia poae]|uniref:hypothetical protein n=1 Tax=Leifsonia poae TaxID=110933 RepID=UPI003D69D4DE